MQEYGEKKLSTSAVVDEFEESAQCYIQVDPKIASIGQNVIESIAAKNRDMVRMHIQEMCVEVQKKIVALAQLSEYPDSAVEAFCRRERMKFALLLLSLSRTQRNNSAVQTST